MDYQPVAVKKHLKLAASKHLPESRYWRQYIHPVFVKEYAPITSVHFSPSNPHRYAVTAATRVQIYAPRTQKITKTISRFKDIARSGNIRVDGKLVVAGDDSGLIQVFDINSRAILRTLDSHKQPVHVAKFSTLESTRVLSCSDDTTVKFWDLTAEAAITTFHEHTDYVRSGQVSVSNPHLILTGSYDGTSRLFDSRTGQSEMVLGDGIASSSKVPVEQVLMFPSGTVAVSSAGPILRVWDLVAGGRCIKAMSNHQKTITALALSPSSNRLLSGSLDHMLKVYDVSDYKVVHTMRYPAPLLCVAISPDNSHIVGGMSDGTLSIRRRQQKGKESTVSALESLDLLHIGAGVTATKHASKALKDADELRVNENRRQKRLKNYDKYLKTFKYSAALDLVLQKNVPPATTFSLIQELIHRDGLRVALSGRDDVLLESILQRLIKHIADPRFGNTACYVARFVIDIYRPVIGQSPLIDALFLRLRKKLTMEIQFQKELLKAKGAISMMLTSTLGKPKTPSAA